MAALLALALRFAGLGAAGLGVSLPAFALLAGLALGAMPAGYVGFRIGHGLGWREGAAASDQAAQLGALAHALAEARLDAAAQRAASADARAAALRNAAAAARARKQIDAYAKELAARGWAGPCGLTDGDLVRLHDNAWAGRGTGRAHAPGRR